MCALKLARCYDNTANTLKALIDLLHHPVGGETFAPFIYSFFDHMVVSLSFSL